MRLSPVLVLLLSLLASCGGPSDPRVTDSTGVAADDPVLRGTIVGLQGEGLVLTVNGARDLLVGPSETVFVWKLPKGTVYSLAVKTAPSRPFQNCTFTNGTGTLNVDATNATLTCTTPSFAIRGTVSGLTGTGLTLLLNGGNSVAITAGASSFAFPAQKSGVTYSVTVGTQPAGQTCAVNQGTGSVIDADVTNVTVTCGAAGFTVGGAAISYASAGGSLRINGGAALSIVPAIDVPGIDWTYPTAFQTNDTYSVVVASTPQSPKQSCLLRLGKGRIASTSVTSVSTQCFANSTLAPIEGTYAITTNGLRSYLTLWADGVYNFAYHSNDNTCANNGNGVEYGVYRHRSNDSLAIFNAFQDTNGGCGLWDNTVSPAQGLAGTMVRNGSTLTVKDKVSGATYVLTAVTSNPASLVGSFVRADGVDGTVIVFESDGTYLFSEAQDSPSTGGTASYERACYTVSGATFTVSFTASCRPDGQPALDLNGTAGFSGRNGAAIPFTVNSATTVTIGGVLYRRLEPQ